VHGNGKIALYVVAVWGFVICILVLAVMLFVEEIFRAP